MRNFFVALLLAVPFLVGAVTWNGDSNQFRWLGTGTKSGDLLKARELSLRCVPDFAQGFLMIHYALPAAAKNAKLNVFNIDGALVRSFDLQAGSTAVRWDYAKDKVAAGVYVASLRYGEAEKNIQISVVK